MQVNRISNINLINTNLINTNFRASAVSKDMESQNAILMLRDPKASVKFQQNQEFAQNADSVNSNPLKALGYKLYRTFSMIRENDQMPQNDAAKQFVAMA